jgi:hypothetical protein
MKTEHVHPWVSVVFDGKNMILERGLKEKFFFTEVGMITLERNSEVVKSTNLGRQQVVGCYSWLWAYNSSTGKPHQFRFLVQECS